MKKLVLFLSFFAFVFTGEAQVGFLYRITGAKVAWYGADVVPADSAILNFAQGGCFDKFGNVYIVENGQNRIRKINLITGIMSNAAGNDVAGYSGDGGLATKANIGSDFNICTDTFANLYIVDNNNRIRKVTASTGIITTVAGGDTALSDGVPATKANLTGLSEVYVDKAGNIYITYKNKVRKVDATTGLISTFAGTGVSGYTGDGSLAINAKLNAPSGLAGDSKGNIFIGDVGNNVVREVEATTGIIYTVAGNGTLGYAGDGVLATAAPINPPQYIAVDPFDNLFIGNGHLRKVDMKTGIISSIFNYSGAYIDTVGISGEFGINSRSEICYSDRNEAYKISFTPTIAKGNFEIYIDKFCEGPAINIITKVFAPGMSITTWFGDGQTNLTVVGGISTFGAISLNHIYHSSGTYTIKHVLYNGTTAIDSVSYTYNYNFCNTLTVDLYNDLNKNCMKDINEPSNATPVRIEVDSNGRSIDTISTTSSYNYSAYGKFGDIYTFRLLSSHYFNTCSGIYLATDTLQNTDYKNTTINFGLVCNTSSNFDLSVKDIIVNTHPNGQTGNIYISNSSCLPVNAIVTLHYSTKYNDDPDISVSPAPASITSNTITWDLNNISVVNNSTPIKLYYRVRSYTSSLLALRDTVNTFVTITPTVGDIDTTNNSVRIIDTVKAGIDPNEMWVTPSGYINGITQLQYTINFENTGNDTAHNIYVMDTLSDYLIPSSMQIVAASGVMNVSKYYDPTYHTILRFDFPNINLLDSSHHGQCDGMVIFNINRKDMPLGAKIDNHAGVFFDDNDVVLTDTVESLTGWPADVTTINNEAIQLYPNPATNILTIKSSNNQFISFSITNSIGQTLIQKNITTIQTTVDVKALTPGIYYIYLKADSGVMVRKFVKM